MYTSDTNNHLLNSSLISVRMKYHQHNMAWNNIAENSIAEVIVCLFINM